MVKSLAGVNFVPWDMILIFALVATVLTALTVVLVLDRPHSRGNPRRVLNTCALFLVILYLAIGIPILIGDMKAARRLRLQPPTSQAGSDQPPTTRSTSPASDRSP